MVLIIKTTSIKFLVKIKIGLPAGKVNDLGHAGAIIILKGIIKLPHCRVTDVVLVGLF